MNHVWPALPPAVIVHGLTHAVAALAPGCPVTLLSAPGAACYAGAGFWRALVRAARDRHKATPCVDILDCADAPGRAFEALAIGQSGLVLLAGTPGFAAVAGAASACGARLLAAAPPALDLARADAARRLRPWLDGVTDAKASASGAVATDFPVGSSR